MWWWKETQYLKWCNTMSRLALCHRHHGSRKSWTKSKTLEVPGVGTGLGYAGKESLDLECGVVETVVWMFFLMLITVVCVGLDARLLGNVVMVYALIRILTHITVANVETNVHLVSCASMGCVGMLRHSLHCHFHDHRLTLPSHFLLNHLDHNHGLALLSHFLLNLNHGTHHTHLQWSYFDNQDMFLTLVFPAMLVIFAVPVMFVSTLSYSSYINVLPFLILSLIYLRSWYCKESWFIKFQVLQLYYESWSMPRCPPALIPILLFFVISAVLVL